MRTACSIIFNNTKYSSMSSFNIPPKSADAVKVISSDLTDTDKALVTSAYPELNDMLIGHFHLKNIETNQKIFDIQDAHQKYKKNFVEVANKTFGILMWAVQNGLRRGEKSVVVTISGSYNDSHTKRDFNNWIGSNIPQRFAIELFETTMAKLCYKVKYDMSQSSYDRDDSMYMGGLDLFVNVYL